MTVDGGACLGKEGKKRKKKEKRFEGVTKRFDTKKKREW